MAVIQKYESITSSGHRATVTIASGPIIIHQGKLLLIKDKKDPFWKIPGGSLEDTETLTTTPIREAFEETGLEITISGAPIIVAFHSEREGIIHYYQLYHYIAHIIGSSHLKLGNDIEKAEFFSIQDIESMQDELAPNIPIIIKKLSNLL